MTQFKNIRSARRILVAAALAFMAWGLPVSAQVVPCSSTGPDIEQAKCLLRPVRRYGELGPPLASLPTPLDRLLGQLTDAVSKEALAAYLRAHAIREADIGGTPGAGPADAEVTRHGQRIIGRSIPAGVKYIVFPRTADADATPENVIERTRAKGAALFAQLCGSR
jgi:hypothetical protein